MAGQTWPKNGLGGVLYGFSDPVSPSAYECVAMRLMARYLASHAAQRNRDQRLNETIEQKAAAEDRLRPMRRDVLEFASMGSVLFNRMPDALAL